MKAQSKRYKDAFESFKKLFVKFFHFCFNHVKLFENISKCFKIRALSDLTKYHVGIIGMDEIMIELLNEQSEFLGKSIE